MEQQGFSFKRTFDALVIVANTLNDSNLSNEQRLEELTQEVTRVLEEVDNLVEFLPPGFREVAKVVVDNPLSDGLEASKVSPVLARLIAEAAYQASRLLRAFGIHWGPGKLEQGATDPTLGPPSSGPTQEAEVEEGDTEAGTRGVWAT